MAYGIYNFVYLTDRILLVYIHMYFGSRKKAASFAHCLDEGQIKPLMNTDCVLMLYRLSFRLPLRWLYPLTPT